MILAAKGLLDEEPRGSRSRIEEYLRGKMGAVQTAQQARAASEPSASA